MTPLLESVPKPFEYRRSRKSGMRQHPARKTALLRLQESNKETYNDCGQRIDEKHRDVNQVGELLRQEG